MGFFSWKCAECDKSVMNEMSHRPEDSDCVLVTPYKNYHESAYQGVGEFAGTDIYSLLGDGDRYKAIKIDCNGNSDDLPFKIKIVHARCHSPNKGYDDYKESETCPVQGFFLSRDEEREERDREEREERYIEERKERYRKEDEEQK